MPLCKALDITANELLSAKILNETEYKIEAEENLLLLKNQQENNAKFLLTIEYVLMSIITIFTMGTIFIASFLVNIEILQIIILIFATILLVISCLFALQIEQKAGYYECKICGHKYIPKYKSVLMAMHIGTTRHMRCPHCHKKSWNKKVTKD